MDGWIDGWLTYIYVLVVRACVWEWGGGRVKRANDVRRREGRGKGKGICFAATYLLYIHIYTYAYVDKDIE